MANVIQAAAKSVRRFVGLAWRHSISLSHESLGRLYHLEQRGTFAVFRETSSDESGIEPPVVLVVGFRLKLLRNSAVGHWLFRRMCVLTTPFWSGFRGFGTKLWLFEPVAKDYLGIYKWSGEQNARQYADTLVRVLDTVSVSGSVWYEIDRQDFCEFLQEHTALTYPNRELAVPI